MPRFLLSCNGDYFPTEEYDNILKSCDYYIAVDGGIRHLLQSKIKPDLWVGDMDSEKDYYLPKISVKTENLEIRKDFSDSEYAVKRAIELGADSIIMIGAIGSRIDHSLFNINLILKKNIENFDIMLTDGRQELRALKKINIIEGKKGKTLSLVPYSKISKLTMEGFSYPLDNVELERFSGLTLSNEIVKDKAIIKISSGTGIIAINSGY